MKQKQFFNNYKTKKKQKKMKVIFALLLCFISTFVCFSSVQKDVKQTVQKSISSVKETIIDVDTSSTTKQIYNDVKFAVKELAIQLKTTTEKVLQIIAKNYYISGIYDIGLVLIVYILEIIALISLKKFLKYNKDKMDIPAIVLCYVAILVCFLPILIWQNGTLKLGILHFLNPEYFVIEDIYNKIKTTIQ